MVDYKVGSKFIDKVTGTIHTIVGISNSVIIVESEDALLGAALTPEEFEDMYVALTSSSKVLYGNI